MYAATQLAVPCAFISGRSGGGWSAAGQSFSKASPGCSSGAVHGVFVSYPCSGGSSGLPNCSLANAFPHRDARLLVTKCPHRAPGCVVAISWLLPGGISPLPNLVPRAASLNTAGQRSAELVHFGFLLFVEIALCPEMYTVETAVPKGHREKLLEKSSNSPQHIVWWDAGLL